MRLSLGPASVSELFEPHAMTLPTLLQHIRVLEISGLIGTKKSGRVRTCAVRPAVLSATEAWLAKQRCLGRSPRQRGRIRDRLTSKGEKHGKRLMTDEVIFMVPGQEPFGKEGFSVASRGMKDVRAEGTSDIQEVQVLGDWAYLRNYIDMTAPPPDGGHLYADPAIRSRYCARNPTGDGGSRATPSQRRGPYANAVGAFGPA